MIAQFEIQRILIKVNNVKLDVKLLDWIAGRNVANLIKTKQNKS